jgi:hypothetical protein
MWLFALDTEDKVFCCRIAAYEMVTYVLPSDLARGIATAAAAYTIFVCVSWLCPGPAIPTIASSSIHSAAQPYFHCRPVEVCLHTRFRVQSPLIPTREPGTEIRTQRRGWLRVIVEYGSPTSYKFMLRGVSSMDVSTLGASNGPRLELSNKGPTIARTASHIAHPPLFYPFQSGGQPSL